MKIREIALGDKILVAENGINPKIVEVSRVTPTLAILEYNGKEYKLLRNLAKPSNLANDWGDFQPYGLEVEEILTFHRYDPDLSEIERKNKILQWVFKYLNKLYTNWNYYGHSTPHHHINPENDLSNYEFDCVQSVDDFYMIHFKSKIDGRERSTNLEIVGEISELVQTFNDNETLVNYIHTLAPLMMPKGREI